MKNLHELNKYRDTDAEIMLYGQIGNSGNGVFEIPCPATARKLKVIASNGEGWDHVSVSLHNRCPNWPEMDYVKRLFFEDHETAMQLHVPVVEHIDMHPYCLHLWRPINLDIPSPPGYMVAV